MRKHRLWLILIGILVVVGVLVAVFIPSREPSYGGKRLSEWVEGFFDDGAPATTSQRGEAIRRIDTNALPYLLKWIRYETPNWKTKCYAMLNPALIHLRSSWVLSDEKERNRANGAVLAFVALGATAESAADELSRLMHDPKVSSDTRIRARGAFALISTRPGLDFPTRRGAKDAE